jgi:hypothetical protein
MVRGQLAAGGSAVFANVFDLVRLENCGHCRMRHAPAECHRRACLAYGRRHLPEDVLGITAAHMSETGREGTEGQEGDLVDVRILQSPASGVRSTRL